MTSYIHGSDKTPTHPQNPITSENKNFHFYITAAVHNLHHHVLNPRALNPKGRNPRALIAITLGGHWGDQCYCSFRTFENCNNIGGSLFENCINIGGLCSKTALTLGGLCSKTAITLGGFVRKLH